ncbi:pantoate--beta-alanine ligase [bacterium]|nr:pantoate--beta-alanine ligase [candidate division CSSED10-310 bacterium]
MRVFQEAREMQRVTAGLRHSGKTIGFVPTMGFFHDGHLQLMREARMKNDVLIISLFVNPLQFGPGEDLDRYPRDLARDQSLALEAGVNYLFAPSDETMYPPDHRTIVSVRQLTEPLCGASRPGHFDGVATVVLKLFNIVHPHQAFFGRKDYQQTLVIKQMVKDLDLDVEIVMVDTVREADGLAMSSRNSNLNAGDRAVAPLLYQALSVGKAMIEAGESTTAVVQEAMRAHLAAEPKIQVEYLEIRQADDLDAVSTITGEVVLAAAARLGGVRLIDNLPACPPAAG